MSTRSLKEMADLSGRTAVVTGAAGNIGYVICEALAELAANIILIDQDEKGCNFRSNLLNEKYSIDSQSIIIDLEDEMSIRTVTQKISDKFDSIEILINCAALVGTSDLKGWGVSFPNQSSETWRKALEINLTAPFILTQILSPLMQKRGVGSVINIGSIYGILGPDLSIYSGTDMGNPAAYAVSKGGLLQMTRWLSTVLAPKIRVNTITPGGILRGQNDTFVQNYCKKTPLQRMGTENDIKGAVAFLSSDLSSYVTGQNIIIDGGWSVW